jgi:glycosyltransferase involved in cell wall biosynthesis
MGMECQSGVCDPAGELRGRDIICFSHDWRGDPLSKTHLMRLLAKRNRVLWVNSVGYRSPGMSGPDIKRSLGKLVAAASPIMEAEHNLFVYNPLAIPLHANRWAQKLNQRWLGFQIRRAMRTLGFERPINWVFNPAAGLIAGRLGEERLIYYCVDEYSAVAGVSATALAGLECALLDAADLVVVSSQELYNAKARAGRTILVRHGVDFEHFRKALDAATDVPADIGALRRPIIGYFGLISHDWVDLDLLVHIARSMPEASLVILGRVAMDVSALKRLPNVYLLGRKPYELLPNYCKGFHAAIIPFPISRLTMNANPLKVREYLAAGLPVVSTAIPEVQVLGQCRIAEDAEGFVGELREALNSPGPDVARSETMRGHTWAVRLAEVEQALLLRESQREVALRMAA